jgi:hypothetical protein
MYKASHYALKNCVFPHKSLTFCQISWNSALWGAMNNFGIAHEWSTKRLYFKRKGAPSKEIERYFQPGCSSYGLETTHRDWEINQNPECVI